jgi:hypothetical protein
MTCSKVNCVFTFYLSLHESVRHFCPVLTRLKFFSSDLDRNPKTKFQENPSTTNRADTCWLKDMTKLTGAFRDIADAFEKTIDTKWIQWITCSSLCLTMPHLNSTTYRFLGVVDVMWISFVIPNMVVHAFFYRDVQYQPFVESVSEQNYFYQVQNCQYCWVLQHKGSATKSRIW